MSPIELLTVVRAAGIRLEVSGDRLQFDAPAGALTPDLRAALVEHKPALLALLAPVTAFVTLKGGLVLPLPAVLLALDLERRGFRLALDADQRFTIERTEDTAELTEITDDERIAIDRWRLHLGALVGYNADNTECPQ